MADLASEQPRLCHGKRPAFRRCSIWDLAVARCDNFAALATQFGRYTGWIDVSSGPFYRFCGRRGRRVLVGRRVRLTLYSRREGCLTIGSSDRGAVSSASQGGSR
jgi:hypothetical protein